MKMKSGSWVLIIILAIALSFGLYLLAYNSLKTILVPAIACSLILVLGAEQLRREIGAGAKTTGADNDNVKPMDEEARQTHIRYLIGYGWLVGFAIAIYLVGFIYATFLFLFFFFCLSGQHRWFQSLMIAILGTAVFWLSFVYWLQSDLWGGVIFDLFTS